jgi:1,4-alpha-glucan branching enzyme
VRKEDIRLILDGLHQDPYSVLGMHVEGDEEKQIAVRAFLPEAEEAWVVHSKKGNAHPMEKVHKDGFYVAEFPRKRPFPYRLRIQTKDGKVLSFKDPYSFGRVLTEYDLHLLGEGTHCREYEKLGAHLITFEGAGGVHFSVWAPNARSVHVIGDFNRWDNRRHPMRLLGTSGIWEIFIPELGEGEKYKFDVRSKFNKYQAVKADPHGFCFERRPKSASVVCDIDGYRWGDSAWLEKRGRKNWFESPVSIYEVHLGSWMRHAHRLREGNGLYTYRTPACFGTSARCVLGISDHRIFRGYLQTRHSRGLHVLCRLMPPQQHRRYP